ncbi:alpha/beta fold hydrolase [Luethyella okanaganae]|uniref:Alpha/beta fold hydrolase n=1 Tax=Luethyella okanaganae TaxID=69372 RepID=A0ABW1VBU5_9MICO
MLLLHGFVSSGAEDWIDTGWATALTGTGRTAIVPDLPGHGESQAVTSTADAATHRILAAIDAVIDASGAEQVDVIGYSLGARLAWDLPAASSGRVRRLVLGGLSPFEPFLGVDLPELERVIAGDAEPGPSLTGFMAQMISAPGRDTASLAHCIAGLASEPFRPTESAPVVPALFVAGRDDQLTDGVEDLVALIDDAEFASVPGDHRGALDSAEFRALALAFLD